MTIALPGNASGSCGEFRPARRWRAVVNGRRTATSPEDTTSSFQPSALVPVRSRCESSAAPANRCMWPSMKPGITGLWQVSGRADLSWEDSIRLDMFYVENWSVMADVVIALKTARVVFKHIGSY